MNNPIQEKSTEKEKVWKKLFHLAGPIFWLPTINGKKNSSDLWSDSALNILQTCQDATDAFDTTWRRSCARIAPFWRDMPPARPWGPVDELMGGGALVSWCITVLALPQAILKRYNLQVYLNITLYSAFQLNIYLCVCKYIYISVCVSKNWKSARLISPTGTSRLTSSASVTSVIFQLLLHRGCGHPHLSPQTAQIASLSHSRAKSSWNMLKPNTKIHSKSCPAGSAKKKNAIGHRSLQKYCREQKSYHF